MDGMRWVSSYSDWLWIYGTDDWNHAHIDRNSKLFLWDSRAPEGSKWAPIETPPGTSIEELKALGTMLVRMNK